MRLPQLTIYFYLMSGPHDNSSMPNFLCQNCHTINTNESRCIQCQSEDLQEIHIQPHHDNTIMNNTQQNRTNDDVQNQQIVLVHDFQNLFRNPYDVQPFSNMLLPMLMPDVQSDYVPQRRRRRSRAPRRIKRITHTQPRHQYVPLFDFVPYQMINNSPTALSLLNLNGIVPPQVLTPQLQPNMTILQMPLPFIFLDPNGENLNPDTLRRLLVEDVGTLPLTRSDINHLPTFTLNPSILSTNPSCAICLEAFDLSSEIKQLPQCQHIFHGNCLTEWLLQHGNCPICRTTINLSSQQVPGSLLNHRLTQPPYPQTIIRQSNHINPSHPPVKSIDSVDHAAHNIVLNHPPADTPRLPRFNSQMQTDSFSSTE